MGSERLTGRWVGTAGGLGLLPVAPGTWSSAAAAGAYIAARLLTDPWWRVALAAAFVVTLVVGMRVYSAAERYFGKEDPGPFVLDEVAAMWLIFLGFWWRGPVATALAVFIAFRVFDIWKPPPVRQLEKLPGALGVMADDLAAGVYSIAALWLICPGLLDRWLT
jgi:phosphatidylglycerophosphatase A